MDKEQIEIIKQIISCKKEAIESIKTCYHPDCGEKSINSHILQKNGILSSIAPDKHLWFHDVDQFKNPPFIFKKIGINKAYSFNCFCNKHDTKLFEKIEKDQIDFEDYESSLLFTLRTVYNELFRKEVNIKMIDCLLKNKPEIFDTQRFSYFRLGTTMGIDDLNKLASQIWNDLNNGGQNFVFKNRVLPKLELCLSSFYNYETSYEMDLYRKREGKEMENVSEIFINFFPYKDNSVLLMGYHKDSEQKVKGYFNTFFKENDKRVQRKLTNLLLFRCETWVTSTKLKNEKINSIENVFADCAIFSSQEINERKTYDLNIYKSDFISKMKIWKDYYISQ
jgi:hypothetical protein